ncbi:sensor histidine kinase [Fictibacillus fluitans]|uniref:Sensor histidine kinase n=1 Tax=Fictibacillus fluitans TaxID=3058422 RepID=A0ABT8HTS1_9BACL|nr:sensor histidine kinase [Fictibacillus sp. NE201]MDN4524153.1 sensor histidine kinase [Fictibacillus sp. NE201]
MFKKFNIFTKINLLIVAMLLPILLLYIYSNRVGTDVVENEISKSSKGQLLYFQSQLDANINRLSLFPNLLVEDPDVLRQQNEFLKSDILDLDAITVIKQIQYKLGILSNSTNWRNQLFVYSPSVKKVISTDPSATYQTYNETVLKSRLKPGWSVRKSTQENSQYDFHWYSVTPFSANNDPQKAKLIIEVQFSDDNIKDMLDEFKQGGGHDPFYYKKGYNPVYNRNGNGEIIHGLIQQLKKEKLPGSSQRVLEYQHKKFLVNAVKSENMSWFLVDYVPLEQIFEPINRSNYLFYLSMVVLLLMSSIAAYLLYNQVQVPINQFISGFRRLKNEDYSVRMEPKGTAEFGYLFQQFNMMAARLEELIERVYVEKLRIREAKLKQLQSQINPHFFYNCFSFISSMAKLNDTKAVVAMSQNLSKYYRYTTRQEKSLVPLEEEVQFVTNYLEIQKMRMKRLNYSIDLPSYMRKTKIPPLTLQPLVENAVIHGIEPVFEAGMIHVKGEQRDGYLILIVDDDGKGLGEKEIKELQKKLSQPMDEEMGCGLWNVHQRLSLHYGEDAGITIEPSPLGGLRVSIRWKP